MAKLPLRIDCMAVSKNIRITHTPGIFILADANTTLGYCRYTESGEVEYIFVSRACRRQGYAKHLLKLVEAHVKHKLGFQAPISPLGEKLLDFYSRHGAQ